MASLHPSALVSHSIGLLHRPYAGAHAPFLICITPRRHISKTHLDLRLKRVFTVQVKNRWSPVFASKSNLSNGSNEKGVSESTSSPPLLTILAGLVVFLFVGWVMISVMTWLIGLIFHPPPIN